MRYEIIREIKNNCSRNQMRDVFFTEEEIPDPDVWIREKEPHADTVERENLAGGVRYRVDASGLLTEYTLTEAE